MVSTLWGISLNKHRAEQKVAKILIEGLILSTLETLTMMTIVYIVTHTYWTYLDPKIDMHARTWTFLMREFKLLIFLCGHLMMFSSLHLFFNTVNPTFISFAALVIGTSKCFCISSNSNKVVLFLLLLVPFSSSLLPELAYSLWLITGDSLNSLPEGANSVMGLTGLWSSTTWSMSKWDAKSCTCSIEKKS